MPGKTLGIEFEIDDLLRMDTATLTAALKDQVAAGITKPNEARRRLNLRASGRWRHAVPAAAELLAAALDKRDTGDDPFGKASAAKPPAAAESAPPKQTAEEVAAEQTAKFLRRIAKGFSEADCA